MASIKIYICTPYTSFNSFYIIKNVNYFRKGYDENNLPFLHGIYEIRYSNSEVVGLMWG